MKTMSKRLLAGALLAAFASACSDHPPTEPLAIFDGGVLHAVGFDPVSGASIETNLDDYYPGQVVHLTGRGWAAGETVRLVMTEEPDTHDDVMMDIVADSSGAFAVDFYDVQEHDLGVTFTLTATGQTSGSVATAVFTDNRVITKVELLDPATNTFVVAPAQITVAANATLTVRVTGTTNDEGGGGAAADDWESTEWHVRGPAPGNGVATEGCSSTIGITAATVDAQHTFTIDGPASAGTYSLDVRAFRSNLCAAGPSSAESYENAIVLANPPANNAPIVSAGDDATIDEGGTFTQAGAFADPDADSWTATVDYGDGSGSQALTLGVARTFTLSHVYDDNGAYTVTVTVNDGTVDATDQVIVTVNNVAPSATFANNGPVDEGSSFTLDLSDADDASAADVAAGFSYAFDCGDGSGYAAFGASSSRNCATDDNGTRSVKGTIRDKDGGETEYTAAVEVNNLPPTISSLSAPATVDEGDDVPFSVSGITDPSSVDQAGPFTYAFSCGAAEPSSFSSTNSGTCPTSDDGLVTINARVRDKDGGESATFSRNVTVNNVPPSITSITLPPGPLAIGSTVSVSWTFDDPGADTWQCRISWDQPVLFTDPFASSGKSCAASSSTLPAGVYTVTVHVKDDDGGEDQRTETAYIVVYDPNGGFVTGGGWIMSPAGAFADDATLTGKATFGFVSKYEKNKALPQGNTEFQFHAAGLNFKSTSYEWLVVAGSRAQYKGEGTLNGQAGYGFLLTAVDGGTTGDKFRIKIWNKAGNAVVYDNQPAAGDDSDAATYLSGGSIVVHNPPGKGK